MPLHNATYRMGFFHSKGNFPESTKFFNQALKKA